jgi:hypothetical protein
VEPTFERLLALPVLPDLDRNLAELNPALGRRRVSDLPKNSPKISLGVLRFGKKREVEILREAVRLKEALLQAGATLEDSETPGL